MQETNKSDAVAAFGDTPIPNTQSFRPNREVDPSDLDLGTSDWKPPHNPKGISCRNCPGGLRGIHHQPMGDGTFHPMQICEVGTDSKGNPGFVDLNSNHPEKWCPFLPKNAEQTIQFLTEDFEQVHDGKLFRTKTAERIEGIVNELPMEDPRYSEVSLHRTQKGQFFLVQKGGFLSGHAFVDHQGSRPGKNIHPLSDEEAKLWLAGTGFFDAAEKIFGKGSVEEA